MTHVDLIEKLLKYVCSYIHTGHAYLQHPNCYGYGPKVLTRPSRYNPAERDAKKAAMN